MYTSLPSKRLLKVGDEITIEITWKGCFVSDMYGERMNQTNQLHGILHKPCTKNVWWYENGTYQEDKSIFTSAKSRQNTLDIFLQQFLCSLYPF